MFNYLNDVVEDMRNGIITVKRGDNLSQLVQECKRLEKELELKRERENKRRKRKLKAKNQTLIDELYNYKFKSMSPSEIKQCYRSPLSTQKITALLLSGIEDGLFTVDKVDDKRLYSVI